MMRAIVSIFFLGIFFQCTITVAQEAGPSVGDNFVFFVDSPNLLVPNVFRGYTVGDPLGAGNKVIQFPPGRFGWGGFQFIDTVGVDMSENREDGDVLYLRLFVDPKNKGQEKIQISFEDKTDGTNADIPFRLVWRVPEHYRNGIWHTLQIPLPPATYTELEEAKTAGMLDSLANYWKYAGGRSGTGIGVALEDELGPDTSHRSDLWREFEWSNVWRFGFHWDNNSGTGGPVYFDDVYIGKPGLDLSTALAVPDAMTNVSFESSMDGNRVSWMHIDPNLGGYNVYGSLQPITDVKADGVSLLESISFRAESFELVHRFPLIHPSHAPGTVYYAVTPLSLFSVENTDISQSIGAVTNPNISTQAYITQLTREEGNQINANLVAGNVTGTGFPDWLAPFVVDSTHSTIDFGTEFLDNDKDLSAKIWAGYTLENDLFVYAEVMDDVVTIADASIEADQIWKYDSIEFGWGNYDVRDTDGGSILLGSSHIYGMRGALADYLFRISGSRDGTQDGFTANVFVEWSIEDEPEGSGAAYDVLVDGDQTIIGWKILARIPLDAIQNIAKEDSVLSPPMGTEIRYIPLNITLNDRDNGERNVQRHWSIRDSAISQWYRRPFRWMTVAMAGRLTVTSVELVEELPRTIMLEQNYPNPFNSFTTIQVILLESHILTLQVYDILGRSVATLIDHQPMLAGSYSVPFNAQGFAPGLYFYRLGTGGSAVQSRNMILVK